MASNVVTEATGASLSPAPAVYCEPAHTNLITYSHEFDNAAWTKTNATITADDTTAPDGSLTADVLGDNSATGTGQVFADSNAITLSGAGSFMVSVFAKAKQLSWIRLGCGNFDQLQAVYFDLTNGVIGATIVGSPDDYGIEAHANGWYRCWVVCNTTTDLTGNMRVMLANANNITGVDLDGTSDVYVWGAQVEEVSAPTSYVATSGATATANATEPVVTWPSGLVNDFVVKFKVAPISDWDSNGGSNPSFFDVDNAAESDRFIFWYAEGASYIRFNREENGSNANLDVTSITPVKGTELEITFIQSSLNGFSCWVDGAGKQTNAGWTGSLNLGGQDIEIGNAGDGLCLFRDLRIYKVSPTISDAQVLAL